MSSQDRVPSGELLAGRRALEGIDGITLLNDWTWDAGVNNWVLHCQLSPSVLDSGPIPAKTLWYVLVDEAYPWGSIKFYPAKDAGIVQTFHHQNPNSQGESDVPWRNGDICLDTTVRVLGRHGYDSEPYGVDERLRWRFERAMRWLEAASLGDLIRDGEPFELPAFPTSQAANTVAFCESRSTFAAWQNVTEEAGLAELSFLSDATGVVVTRRYRSTQKKTVHAPSWGIVLQEAAGPGALGAWLRLPQVPVLFPWQVPTTWAELREACGGQGVDIDHLLKRVVPFLRDDKRHIAVLGFPIPGRVGDPPLQMHWQALMLPRLSSGTRKARGFRENEMGYWKRDRTEVLRGDVSVDWLASENWDAHQISTRGRLSERLTAERMLLLGAGAVGSALAELLVRGGVRALTVMDGDRLEAGNLVRHSLTLDEVNHQKAGALAGWLNKLTPFASVHAINSNFPPVAEADRLLVQQCEIVIDCTGGDEVLHHMESFPWEQPKLFFSVSLGRQARRLFVFVARSEKFPHSKFNELIDPWLTKEMEEHRGEEWPSEGIGCWHPVFPARIDDVRILVSIALKQIESAGAEPPREPELVVFEQQYKDGRFASVRHVRA